MSHGIYQDQSGLYGLCVFDAETYPDDEILNVFEKFGPVADWNRIKNLVFIRYSTLEEAVQCYNEMQSSSKFRVKAARRKTNGDRPDSQRGRDRFSDQNNDAEMNNMRRNERASSNRTGDYMQSAMRTMPKLKFEMPESERLQECGSDVQVDHRVILAHLHPHMKQSDVYMLCAKADAQPAHVDMKTFTRPPYSPEHYAIVHVMKEADVRNIVRGLNNLKINGYQLVVASYEKLLEEGKTPHSCSQFSTV